jgi:hypothetical protein
MSDRRVVLGKRLDGSFGLDVSLAGTDALTGDRNDVNTFSFSSDWQDIVKYSAFGKVYVDVTSPGIPSDPYAATHLRVAIPNYGYVPHFETRGWDGANRVYDDTWVATDTFGLLCECLPSSLDFRKFAGFGYFAVYLIYRYPLDQQ